MGNNQPKKYRNFMIGAASAALVATAVAPVASAAEFSDVKGNTHEAAIKALVEAGVINGYPDGTFKPNKTLTRSDVVKMMGKWLVSLDYQVPADYKTNPRFKDLTSKSNDELLKYAALVKDHGVFNGYADGTLGAGKDITRENMAIVLVRAYDAIHKTDLVTLVKETEFDKDVTDLAKAKAEARPYIDVLDYFDITNPVAPQFNPKNTTTRGQFASFLYKTSNVNLEEVADSEAPKLVYTGEKTLNVEYGKEFTAPVVTATDNVDEKVEVTSVITNEAGERLTAIDTKVPGTYKITYSAVDAAGNSAEDLVVTVVVAQSPTPEVTSVAATNLKEVKLTFNNELDQATAEEKANYTLSSGTVDNAKLSADKKSVILTLTAPAQQQQTIDVTVKNVKDAIGKTVADTKKSVTFFDATAPVAEKVEVVGPNTLKVTFSEPMNKDVAVSYKLNGGAYSVTPAFSADGKSAILTLGTVLPNTTHELEVSGGKDFAGFAITKSTLSFNYQTDTTAPKASIEKADETSVTIKFDKPVKATGLNTDVTVYHTINNAAGYKGTLAPVNADANGYADTYKATFATPIPAGADKTVFLNTKENKLEDLWGNDVASTSLTFGIVSDTTAPSVTKVEATGTAQKEITVTFSEEVVQADAENKANYTIKDANGKVLKTADIASVVYNNTNKTTVITTAAALPAGATQLTVENVKDTSFNSNKLTSQTTVFTVGDKIAPTVGNATLVGTDVIYVDFSEAMDTTGMTDVSKYRLSSGALPANTKIELVNNKRVKITLPSDHGLSGTQKVQVDGNFKDLAGNTIGGFFGESSEFTFGTPTAFEITPANKQVKLVAANQLQFEVPTELSAIDVDKFSFTGKNITDVAVSSATYVNNNGKATVTVTLSKDLPNSDLTNVDKLVIAAEGLTNSVGTKLKEETTFNVEHFEDKLAAKITKVETTDNDEITITFSEAIPANEISNATFVVDGNTVASITHAGDMKTVVLNLTTPLEANATPKVTQKIDIKDNNGNVLVAGTPVKATEVGIVTE